MAWIHPVVWLLCMCECLGLAIPRVPSQTVTHGELRSPLYPQPYPPSLSESWYLSVLEGYRIKLTFIHLDVESSPDCYYDSVTVTHKNKVLGKFCGQKNSVDGHHPGDRPILSPGNHLHVIFQTDDSNAGLHQYTGFAAFYQAVDVDECALPDPDDGSGPLCSQICHNTMGSYLCSCHHGYELRPDQRTCDLACGGGLFSEPEGALSSPGYPQPSPHGLSCQYHISVEPGFTVTLNFTGLFLIETYEQDDRECPYHWLQVSIAGQDPMKLCGQQSPGVIHTQSHSVMLEYRTDLEGLSYGWHMQYSSHRVQCESPKTIAHGEVTPKRPQHLYRDHISVRCDTGYKLMKGGEEIQSYSSMCQSDGQWHIPLPECHVIDCGEPTRMLNGGVSFISGAENKHNSVIEYRCNEPFYSLAIGEAVNYTCKADRKWKDHKSNYNIPKCIPVCGRPTVSLLHLRRVLGGRDAPAGAFPWQAMIVLPGSGGGAAVIGDRWLITAAHVTPPGLDAASIKVHVGSNDADQILKTSPLRISSIHRHPEFVASVMNHDIALIKLHEPLTFNKFVMPLCLPAEGTKYQTGNMGLVSGFGLMEARTHTDKLKYVELPLVDQDKCKRYYADMKAKDPRVFGFTDNMFCAGYPDGRMDTCQGDSGGALVLKEDGQYRAVGIVSWGIDCGNAPGVYTHVGNYLDWIQKTMEEI